MEKKNRVDCVPENPCPPPPSPTVQYTTEPTGLVLNANAKRRGVPAGYYRKRSMVLADSCPTLHTAEAHNATLKRMQQTTQTDASRYTAALKALASVAPVPLDPRIRWNNLSDRWIPSVASAGVVPTAYNTQLNHRRYSVTSSRPGGQQPGGVGCDIKHGSYERYLNRLKGAAPLRASPGKTSLVSGCTC